jgi:hypothetical protein
MAVELVDLIAKLRVDRLRNRGKVLSAHVLQSRHGVRLWSDAIDVIAMVVAHQQQVFGSIDIGVFGIVPGSTELLSTDMSDCPIRVEVGLSARRIDWSHQDRLGAA